jgi:hypothetical protein
MNDILVQESFMEEFKNINNALNETNSKLQELIVSNSSKNNDVIQKQIIEKLGLLFF